MGWIFRMNMAACIVVPCIAAARKKLLYRIPGRTWLFLWKILIFRLLCPLTFELQLKNVDVSRTAANIFRQREKMGLPADGLLLSVSEILKIIWLAGVIAAVVFFVSSHLAGRRLYCMSLPVEGVYFEKWKKSHSLRRKVEIKKSGRIAAPLTYGLIKPVILLPAYNNMKEESLGFILEHEFIHIKRLDILLKWILVFTCSFYWYNPLIWVMYFFVNRDIELSCDEILLKNQTLGYRKEYLNLLIDLESKKLKGNILCSPFCKYPIEERIKVMVKIKKETPKGVLLSLLIACFIIILNIGTMAKAEAVCFDDENKTHAIGHSEITGEISNIVGYDEESAYGILLREGFSCIIKTMG